MGLSATSLIDYLLENSDKNNWQVTVGDYDYNLALQKVNDHPNGIALEFDVFDVEQRNDAIRDADIGVYAPASMHVLLAEDCVIQV